MISKLVEPFRQFGVVAGLLYAIDRVLNKISDNLRLRYYELLLQPIQAQPLIPTAMAQRFKLREIREGDPEVALMPARTDIKQARFRQGAICLGAFDKERLAGYIWFCCREYEEDEVRCTFVLTPEDSSVFDFDLYIFPEYRMGLAFMAIWNGANEFLCKRGIARSYSRLTRYNLPSRRAHRRLGAAPIAYTCFLQIGSIEVMVATLFPFIDVTLRRSSRIFFKLKPR